MSKSEIFVIIEDDAHLAEILREELALSGMGVPIKVFSEPSELILSDCNPSLIILDMVTPGISGLEAVQLLITRYPNAQLLINTIVNDSETIFKSLQMGAIGYIDKQALQVSFTNAISTVRNGGAFMTPNIARKVLIYFQQKKQIYQNLTQTEEKILDSILDGLSYKLIADRHSISINTVRMHIKNIYRKLSVNSKSELFNKAGRKF